jgi:hypothetical protein
MAFNNLGTPVWVDSGADIFWWYLSNTQLGAQYAMANCLTAEGQMTTTSQGTQLNEDGSSLYHVLFHNYGPQPCFHNLNGGGVS